MMLRVTRRVGYRTQVEVPADQLDAYALGAFERMTVGGVQWIVDPKVPGTTTHWRIRIDPITQNNKEYWLYVARHPHALARPVHPFQIGPPTEMTPLRRL